MPSRTRLILSWAVWWSAVFAANTALPFACFLSTRPDAGGRGQFGVWAGAWTLWAGWLVAGAWSARLRAVLILGGTVVALTQIVPVVQLLAAAGGDTVAGSTLGWRKPSTVIAAEAKGMISAVTAGQLILGLMLVAGYLVAPRPTRPLRLATAGQRRGTSRSRARPAEALSNHGPRGSDHTPEESHA
jgi:hypothetical protein